MKENNTPFFSIILPVYNVGEYLPKCLDSILSQTYNSYEIICVDDGSTDNSGNICDTYSKNYNKIKTFHKNNEGLGLTRNFGLQKCTGNYVFFVDSDDFIPNDKCLEKIHKKLDGTNIQVLNINFCSWSFETKEFEYSRPLSSFNEYSIQEEIDHNLFSPSAWSKIIKREFLIDHNIYFQKGISEDFLWTAKILKCRPIIESLNDDYYYCYRNFRTNSLTQTYNVKYLDTWAHILNDMYDIFDSSNNEILRDFLSKSYFDIVMTFSKRYADNIIAESQILKALRRSYSVLHNSNVYKSYLLYMIINIFGPTNAVKIIRLIKR